MDIEVKTNKNISNLDVQKHSYLLYEAVDYNLLLVNYKTLNVITNYEFVNQFMQKNGQKGLIIFDVPKNADFSNLKSWPNLKGIFFEYADETLFEQGFKAIEQGELWFPRPVTDCWTRIMLEEEQHTTLITNNLTKKEIKVLKLLHSGIEYSAIADSLFISEATVRVHLHKIYQKIDVKNKQQAIAWCKSNFNKFSS